MRFRFIEENAGAFETARLCEVMDVSSRGLRAFRSRPASRRQRYRFPTMSPVLGCRKVATSLASNFIVKIYSCRVIANSCSSLLLVLGINLSRASVLLATAAKSHATKPQIILFLAKNSGSNLEIVIVRTPFVGKRPA